MYNIYKQFKKNITAYKIALGHSLINLIWFLPYSMIAGIFICRRRKITHIHIGEASLAPIGYFISKFANAKLSITVHGLDVIYENYFNKRVILYYLRRCDVIICNSYATREACVERGVDKDKCHVAPCGVDINSSGRRLAKHSARENLKEELRIELDDKVVMATVGRLIRRKGVAWFIEHVIPSLPRNVIYLVAGAGPELKVIRELVGKLKLSARVFILGKVPDSTRDLIYDAADLFAMPNIRVEGDLEGFGIVIIEAGIHDLPVVASSIDGIPDAVIDGVTGRLVRESDPESFIRGIDEVLSWDLESKNIKSAVIENYSWERVYQTYAEALGLDN